LDWRPCWNVKIRAMHFVSNDYDSLDALAGLAQWSAPAALRRQALIAARYPKLLIRPLRGNLDTRHRQARQGRVRRHHPGCSGFETPGFAATHTRFSRT
jgi:hydroxymethylbilane synthase